MIKKLKNILKSRFIYKTKVPYWVQDRRDKCNPCEYNFKNKKNKSAKDYLVYLANGCNNQCTICGCSIKHKTKIKEEFCALEHIGQEPKWDIYENN